MLAKASITNQFERELNFKLLKFNLGYKKPINTKTIFDIQLAAVNFFDLKTNITFNTVEHDGFLPEVKLGVIRTINKKYAAGIYLDQMNYFVLNDVSIATLEIEPQLAYRVSILGVYNIYDFSIYSTIGFLTGPGTGYDFTVGSRYNIGKKDKLSMNVNLAYYKSFLKVSNFEESSNVLVFSYGFSI